MQTEAEIGVMQLQSIARQKVLGASRCKEASFSRALGGGIVLWTPWFCNSML